MPILSSFGLGLRGRLFWGTTFTSGKIAFQRVLSSALPFSATVQPKIMILFRYCVCLLLINSFALFVHFFSRNEIGTLDFTSILWTIKVVNCGIQNRFVLIQNNSFVECFLLHPLKFFCSRFASTLYILHALRPLPFFYPKLREMASQNVIFLQKTYRRISLNVR